MMVSLTLVLLTTLSLSRTLAFAPSSRTAFSKISVVATTYYSNTRLYYQDDAPSDTSDESDEEFFADAIPVDPEAVRLQQDILQIGEETNRGFTASKTQRQQVKTLVAQLMQFNPTKEPALAYYEKGSSPTAVGPTLAGKWTLVYTDAPDITSLDGGPLATAKLGRIGQECAPPFINNVIEWRRPDWAASLPLSGTDESRVLQKVCTEAFASPDEPTKVNLKLVGLELQGKGSSTTTSGNSIVDAIQTDGIPAGLLENNPINLKGPLTAPFGRFEILYLDDEMRIIRTSQGFLAINVRPEQEWF